NSNYVCWDFEFSNLPVSGPPPPTSGTPNVFIGLPTSTPTLSNWEVIIGASTITPVNGIFPISTFLEVGSTYSLSGQICADYSCNSSIPIPSTTLSYGWNCGDFPATNNPLDACLIENETITLTNEIVNLAIDESNTDYPDDYTTCLEFEITACYRNLEEGHVIPQTISFSSPVGPNLTINPILTISNQCTGSVSYSETVTSPTYSWNIFSNMEDLFSTGGIMVVQDCFCVTFELKPECGFDGIIPDIVLEGENYCGEAVSVLMVNPTLLQNSDTPSNCNNCYEITKTANVSTAVEGTELVTFTIEVCADNGNQTTVTMDDLLPTGFDLVSIYSNSDPFIFDLDAQECKTFTVSGYMNSPGECNEASVFNSSITPIITFSDDACVDLTTCLPGYDHIIPKNTVSYGGIIGDLSSPTKQVNIQGDFTIDGTFAFINCNIILDPGARIIVKSSRNLVIRQSTLTPCLKMWRGIELNVGSFLLTYESTIEGAEIAVLAKTGSYPNLLNTIFKDNYVSLNIPYSLPWNTSNCTISGCEFSGSGTMYPPYTGQVTIIGNKPFAGIIARRNQLQITPSSVDINTFSGLSNGIIGLSSDLRISNCIFEDILPDPAYEVL
ncbi:MAG: hypothetical protein IT281_10410, partial [Ignavibacteria bacterium]|nr:hypothetical protein [Ignavibacteria bacterium]